MRGDQVGGCNDVLCALRVMALVWRPGGLERGSGGDVLCAAGVMA